MSQIEIHQVLQQMRLLEARARNESPAIDSPRDGAGRFGELMQQAIDQVNRAQGEAAGMARALEAGDPNVDLAEVMVTMQKASLSFQALTEVRNKLLTAYQDIMNMPV
jgi:flagellar hook-basal body complex protein FliE